LDGIDSLVIQNLLVSEDGVVKIADFGISKMMSTSNKAVQDAAGTPAFMSPELWELHQGEGVSGPLADVWALGGTMFMLRFGHPPFIAASIMTLGQKIRTDPLVFPQPIDNMLKDLIENMLVKDPAKRFTLEKVLMHPYLRHPPSNAATRLSMMRQPAPPSSSSLNAGGAPFTPTTPGPHASVTSNRTSPNSTSTVGIGITAGAAAARSAKGTPIDFTRPPDSYHHQEQAAMSQFVTNVSQKDIFASIGGVNKRKKGGGSGKGANNESSGNLSASNMATRLPGLADASMDEDIMVTGWGGEVFEHIDDVEIDSDIDEEDEVDDDYGAAGTNSAKQPANANAQAAAAGAGAGIGAGVGSELSMASSIASNNSKPDMSVEEEERRLKRFQQLQTKKSFDYSKAEEMSVRSSISKYGSMPMTAVSEQSDQSIDSHKAGPLVGGTNSNNNLNSVRSVGSSSTTDSRGGSHANMTNVRSPLAAHSQSGSGTIVYSPAKSSKRSRRPNSTPSNDGGLDDEDYETESVDMEGFARMMDTLAQQPRRIGDEMETALMTLDISDTVVSTLHCNNLNGVKAAYYSEQGPRPSQEDRCVLLPDISQMRGLADYDFGDEGRSKELLAKFSVAGVFDGHSGWRTSEFLCQHLCPALAVHPKLLDKHIDTAIIETFAEAEKEVQSFANRVLRDNTLTLLVCCVQVCAMLNEEDDSSGSTAILAIYDGRRNVLTVAAVGDSMCVLSRGGKAVPLLAMHRLNNPEENKRVVACGGTILNHRVNGILAVTRAMGDVQFKAPGSAVIAEPEIVSELITPMTEFAIVATDGVWDVMSPQAAVNFARKKLAEHANTEVDMREVAKCIAKEALALGSVDNVTVLVMSFHL
jgi:serine/threonine protein phosphatase PrpC